MVATSIVCQANDYERILVRLKNELGFSQFLDLFLDEVEARVCVFVRNPETGEREQVCISGASLSGVLQSTLSLWQMDQGEIWEDALSISSGAPETRGVADIQLQLQGERIMAVRASLIPAFRTNWTCFYHESRIRASEALAAIRPSERARAIRMGLMEWERIISHSDVLAHLAHDLRSEVLKHRLQEGSRSLSAMIETWPLARVGGLSADLTLSQIQEGMQWLDVWRDLIDDAERSTTRSAFFMKRTRMGAISSPEALRMGLSGPNARASGVNVDLRRNDPYDYYRQIDFDVPIGVNGEAYDRYLVRVHDIRQSIRILEQLLYNLPSGPVSAIALPPVRQGESQVVLEGPEGELGLHAIWRNSGRVDYYWRHPIVPVWRSVNVIMRDQTLSDFFPTLASLAAYSPIVQQGDGSAD